jgi:hypothetical protein
VSFFVIVNSKSIRKEEDLLMNTALRAAMIENEKRMAERQIIFRNAEHEAFYQEYLAKCRYQDEYHKALVYCLGLERDTRKHVDRIYDFKTGLVKTECLKEGWQTSGTLKVVRMAFNLYCNGTPSVCDYRKKDDQLRECRYYTVEELFCCGLAKWFFEAVKVRYPEYCYTIDWEEYLNVENTSSGNENGHRMV